MQTEPLVISFPDTSVAEGNRLAGELANELRGIDPGIVVERRRERSDTQDFGATLSLIIGTAAVTVLAKGLSAWLARSSGARIEIHRTGKLILRATHLDSRDVSRIVEAISREA